MVLKIKLHVGPLSKNKTLLAFFFKKNSCSDCFLILASSQFFQILPVATKVIGNCINNVPDLISLIIHLGHL